MKLTDDLYQWICEHRNDDPSKLRLRLHKQLTPELDFALLQIECRRKAAKKLPDTLANQRFVFPTTLSAEQCTSDLLAQFHSTLVDDGLKLIDLTSGLGIDVFHFAHKANSITAVELNPVVADALSVNAQTLGLDNVSVVNGDCVEYVANCHEHYDVAFIDPARRGANGQRLFALSDCDPDVTAMLPSLRKICRKVIVKASPMLDVTQTLRELPETTHLYVIGTQQECKEIVAVVDFEANVVEPQVIAVTLTKDAVSTCSFSHDMEADAVARYAIATEGQYLYEPYPSTMKAAPLKLLSQRYGVEKLHVNTHLYVSNDVVADFPGEIFKIERIIPFSSKEIKQFKNQYKQINVAARNFIMSADELRRKLNVKDGGNSRVIGCTMSDDSRVLLVVNRV
jgi:hypothetical protein